MVSGFLMEFPSTQEKRQLIAWIRREIGSATGRSYSINFEALDVQSLRAFQAPLRALQAEGERAGPRS